MRLCVAVLIWALSEGARTFGPGPNRAALRSVRAVLGSQREEGGLRVGWPLMFLTKGGLAFIEGGLRVGWLLSFLADGGLPLVIGRKRVGWCTVFIGLTCRLSRPITFSSALSDLLVLKFS